MEERRYAPAIDSEELRIELRKMPEVPGVGIYREPVTKQSSNAPLRSLRALCLSNVIFPDYSPIFFNTY